MPLPLSSEVSLGASSQHRGVLHRPAARRFSRVLRQRPCADAQPRRGCRSRNVLRQPPDPESDLLSEPRHHDHGTLSAPPRHDDKRADNARWPCDFAWPPLAVRLRHARGREAPSSAHHGLTHRRGATPGRIPIGDGDRLNVASGHGPRERYRLDGCGSRGARRIAQSAPRSGASVCPGAPRGE